MTYAAYNTLLYLKRKELKLSRKKAAFKLHMLPLHLKLIEKGYFQPSKKTQQKFINLYGLDDDFFSSKLGYPEEYQKHEKNKQGFFQRLFSKLWFKIGSSILFAAFVGMSFAGVNGYKYHIAHQAEFFDEDFIYLVDEQVRKNPEAEVGSQSNIVPTLLGDSYYSLSNENIEIDKALDRVSICVFKHDNNLPYTFFEGIINVLDLEGNTTYKVLFESRCNVNSERIKVTMKESQILFDQVICYISADRDYNTGKYHYNYVQAVDENNTISVVEPSNILYDLYTSALELFDEGLQSDIELMFSSGMFQDSRYEGGQMSYEKFKEMQINGVQKSNYFLFIDSSHMIAGPILAIIFLALAIASIFIKSKAVKVMDEFSSGDTTVLEEEYSPVAKKEPRKLKKNWKIAPVIPETVLRIFSIALLMTASILIFVVYQDVLSINFSGIYNAVLLIQKLNTFTIAAMLLYFFTKIDANLKHPNLLRTNYILFFAGILYYYFLIFVKIGLSFNDTFGLIVSSFVLDYLPGNIVFGMLAFNMLIMFLFITPKKCEDNKKKLILYRLGALLPFSYLIASCVLTILKKNGLNIPFEIYSLFFSKSFILILFAIVYTIGIYVYRAIAVRKYGREQFKEYVLGNKYYFIKNIIAASIVLVIALVDYFVGKANPGNLLKLGSNYYIALIIPFILLYHPHQGKRSLTIDYSTIVLYVLSLCIGIVLIVLSFASYIISI